jgi:cellulose synthase/poly-beta-1,6-N-acetylglucosamine synthase-like glycosyltransferase
LLLFLARRWLFTLVTLWPGDAPPADPVKSEPAPDVLLLAPVRNELAALPGFLRGLAGLDYPADRLSLALIDDGSTDGSDELLRAWASEAGNRYLLDLDQSRGKAQALNLALAAFPQGDIVAIYDADDQPQPDALLCLVGAFAPGVGGVSGRRVVANLLAAPAASYVAFENLVHQLVTMRAKDRLGLAPAILGSNCAYRRIALSQVGNFKPGALLEDSDLTLKLARAGWTTRFEPRAVSHHSAPATVSGYWQQHTRWARGFGDVAREQAGAITVDKALPFPLRLELLAFSLGYLDRLALLLDLSFYFFNIGRRPLTWLLPLSLLTPLLQLVVALKISRASITLWTRLVWVPFFFLLDIAMAVTGFWRTLKQSPQIWEERRARV